MKKTVWAALMLAVLLAGQAWGQAKTWQFSYDGSGNRIKRELVAGGGRYAAGELEAGEEAAVEVAVYPNPSPGLFTVDLPEEAAAGAELSVHDAGGRLLYFRASPAPRERIDLTAQPHGVYLVRIKTAKAVVVKKILKE